MGLFSGINKKIGSKFSVVFGIFTLTVSASYMLSFWFNKDLKRDAIAIEIASTNRMLTQKMAFKVQSFYYSNQNADKLKLEIHEMHQQYLDGIQLLLKGGSNQQMTGGVVLLPEQSDAVKATINQLIHIENTLFEKVDALVDINGKNSPSEKLKIDELFDSYRVSLAELKQPALNSKLVRVITKKGDDKKIFFQNLLIFLLLLNLSIMSFTYFYLRRTIKPIEPIKDYLSKLSKGELPTHLAIKTEDEIGQITNAVNILGSNIEAASLFAENVGNGKLDTDIEVFENQGKLSDSLRAMRDSLAKVADEEAKRNWATEGFAKFIDIVRSTEDIEVFYNNILGNLVRYLHVNQGYLYILNDENPDDLFMEVKAVYAYGKKKYLEEDVRIHYKEGMVGQAWFDKDALYFTEIPNSYVRITSGMGEALPTCILIVPLLINENVVGALELASFKPLEEYERDFVFKLGETIAGAVQNVKVNERTKKLLEESQHKEEALLAQEEEIRQNMEEMQATQEEMERAQRAMRDALDTTRKKEQEAVALQEEFEQERNEIKAQFEAQLAIINETAIVSKTDLKGNITYVNDMFCKVAKYTREELIGQPHNIVRHEDMPGWAFEDLWRTISSGKLWQGQVKNKCKDGSYYWVNATIAPILGENGKPIEYMAVRYLITDLKNQEDQLKEALEKIAKLENSGKE